MLLPAVVPTLHFRRENEALNPAHVLRDLMFVGSKNEGHRLLIPESSLLDHEATRVLIVEVAYVTLHGNSDYNCLWIERA